jgi:hypothetical protein
MAGKTQEAEFEASAGRVWVALVRTVGELGYATLSSDKSSGSLSFNTGRSMKSWAGQDLNATVLTLGEGRSRIVIGGTIARTQSFGGSQIASWGEKKTLAIKVLDRVRESLPSIPDPAAAEAASHAGVSSGGIGTELAQLASLHQSGALSDEEFASAKQRLLST